MHADYRPAVVDVGPGEAEGFADPEPGVGEEIEQEAVAGGMGKQEAELRRFEDRDRLRRPARLLRGFELSHGVIGQPAAADGELADLAERDQRDHRRRRRKRALVRIRPRGDAVDGQVAQPNGAERLLLRIGRRARCARRLRPKPQEDITPRGQLIRARGGAPK